MTAIPEGTLAYLRDPALTALWDAVASRLERTNLSLSSSVRVTVDAAGASHLSGLLGRPVMAGQVTMKLVELDDKLRALSGGAGLVAVIEQIRRAPLTDRRKVNAERAAAAFQIARQLDDAVTAGLTADGARHFTDGVRASGVLTRAGSTASKAISQFGSAWAELVSSGSLEPDTQPLRILGELAFKHTGTAHGLDEGTVVSKLMMRALAIAFDEPVPTAGEGRRRLWELAGVSTDAVSGTVLLWGFRPPGDDLWSQTMRSRDDLGVPTHLAMWELRTIGDTPLVPSGTTVFACENPQVLQAAASARIDAPLMCLSGQGSAAAWFVLRKLIDSGSAVKYHGDFDWPGISITARAHAAGAIAWRMSTDDYTSAVRRTAERELTDGKALATPWDPMLSHVMAAHQIVVHEEAVLDTLLADMKLDELAP